MQQILSPSCDGIETMVTDQRLGKPTAELSAKTQKKKEMKSPVVITSILSLNAKKLKQKTSPA